MSEREKQTERESKTEREQTEKMFVCTCASVCDGECTSAFLKCVCIHMHVPVCVLHFA